MILEIIAWAATAWALCSYAYMVKTGNHSQFNWMNFLSAIPLCIYGISVGAYPNVVVCAFFGMIGLYGIIQSRKRK